MRAAGSMRDSQSLLEQLLSTGTKAITAADVTTMLGIAPATRLSQLVRPLVERDAAAALSELDSAVSEGAEVSQLIDQLLGYFPRRDDPVGRLRRRAACSIRCPASRTKFAAYPSSLGVQTLLAIAQMLDQTAARMRVSTHTRTLAEMAIVRICHLENLDELSAVVAQAQSRSRSVGCRPSGKKKRNALDQRRLPFLQRIRHRTPSPAPAAPAPGSNRRCRTTGDRASRLTAYDVADRCHGGTADRSARGDCHSRPTMSKRFGSRCSTRLAAWSWTTRPRLTRSLSTTSGRLQVSFGEAFHRDFCEKPANRARIDQALTTVCGSKVAFTLATHARAHRQTRQARSRRALATTTTGRCRGAAVRATRDGVVRRRSKSAALRSAQGARRLIPPNDAKFDTRLSRFRSPDMFKGLGNLGNIMKQAQEMGGKMQQLTEELKAKRVVGNAGGGMVEVEANGLGEAIAVRIDPALIEKQDRELTRRLCCPPLSMRPRKRRRRCTPSRCNRSPVESIYPGWKNCWVGSGGNPPKE